MLDRRVKAEASTRVRLASEALGRPPEEAVGAVTGEIGGTASSADRRAVAELQTAVAELDGLIDGVRRAVVDGRRYAESL